jgi:hypothetical protein
MQERIKDVDERRAEGKQLGLKLLTGVSFITSRPRAVPTVHAYSYVAIHLSLYYTYHLQYLFKYCNKEADQRKVHLKSKTNIH